MAPSSAPASTKSTTSSNDKKDRKQSGGAADEKKRSKPIEYNPHWKGYVYIFIASMINVSAASNVSASYRGTKAVAVMFGSVTMGLSFLIVLLDRTKWMEGVLGDFHKAKEGKVEGIALLLMLVWWVTGCGYQTQVGGIAYLANNVYFSSWMSLASCIHTLNLWSTDKDILSIKELTSISETLPSWYFLLLGSIVCAGTSVNLWVVIYESLNPDAALGMALGLASFCISFLWILAHYNFIEFINEGGWLELGSSFFCVLLWIVGVASLTSEGSVAATMVGSGCRNSDGVTDVQAVDPERCIVVYIDSQDEELEVPCADVLERTIPGSNMYFSLWLGLGSSMSIAFAWKRQQARNLAKAQNQRQVAEIPRDSVVASGVGSSKDLEDDDEDGSSLDLDDFIDAAEDAY